MIKILAIILSLLWAVPAFAADYYASPSGSGTTCSEGSPCSLTYAVETKASSGDTVYTSSGSYGIGSLDVPVGVSLRGSTNDKTLVTIYPNTDLTTAALISISSSSPGSAGNQTLSYLTLDGNYDGSHTALIGVMVKNRNSVTLDNLTIQDFNGANESFGVKAYSDQVAYSSQWWNYWPEDPQAPGTDTNIDALWPTNPVENFVLSNSTITNCGYSTNGLTGGGGGGITRYPAVRIIQLKNSQIHDNVIDTTGSGSYSQPIKAVCAWLDNVDIYNNTLTMPYYSSSTGSQYTIELWLFRGGCEIHNNTVNANFSLTYGKETKIYNNVLTSSDALYGSGQAIEFIGQSEGEVYQNYIGTTGVRGVVVGLEGLGGKAYVVRNVSVHHNIIYGQRGAAVDVRAQGYDSGNVVTQTVEYINVYNNTADTNYASNPLYYVQQSTGSSVTGAVDHINFKNNVAVNADGYAGKTSGTVTNLSIDHNLFYGNGTNDWSGSTDTNTIVSDPSFTDGTSSRSNGDYYEPSSASSPLVDAGVDVGLTEDFRGDAIPYNTLFDIGAIEYGASSGGSNPTVTVSAVDSQAEESGTTTGTFRISCPSCSGESIAWTMGGTATETTDYTLDRASPVVMSGSDIDIVLTPVDDSDVEGSETATMTINASASYDRGNPYEASITILDDDIPTPPASDGDIVTGAGGMILVNSSGEVIAW